MTTESMVPFIVLDRIAARWPISPRTDRERPCTRATEDLAREIDRMRWPHWNSRAPRTGARDRTTSLARQGRRCEPTNPPVRFEPGDGAVRRRLGHAGGRVRRAAAARHHADPGRLALGHQLEPEPRYRLRPGGEPVSRLRAWLRLLLRPADARLSRLLARPRFRDQAAVQAGCGGAAGEGVAQARLRRAHAGARVQHRSVSAGRTHAEADARRCCRCLDRFNHPVSIVTKSAGVLRDLDILHSHGRRATWRASTSPSPRSIQRWPGGWSRAPPRPRGGCTRSPS